MKMIKTNLSIAGILGMLLSSSPEAAGLTNADEEKIVRRSLQYVTRR